MNRNIRWTIALLLLVGALVTLVLTNAKSAAPFALIMLAFLFAHEA